MSGSSKRPALGLSDADRRMLWFLAEHRMVLDRQVAVLLNRPVATLDRRLDELQAAGYLARFGGWSNSQCCRIRQPGLTAIGSELGPPRQNPGAFRHDIGVAWLWLVAHRGTFGSLADVVGERRLRSADITDPDRPYSVRLGGYDGHGHPCVHYPDLVLIGPGGRRVALELELSTKNLARRNMILAGYGADRRLAGVVYFVERNRAGRGIAHRIQTSAAEMGVADRLHIRTLPPIRLDGSQAPEDRGAGQPRGLPAEPTAAVAR